MRRMLTWFLVISLSLNGLAMLLIPQTWFGLVPSVPPTGPFNPHFVRDVGIAYVVCGWAMAWFALDPLRGAGAAIGAAVLQIAHSFLHVWDLIAGRSEAILFVLDIVLVIVPAALMMWLAWPRHDEPDRLGSAA
ncbi:MAG: hypothetical protein ACREUE_01805 [Panacagrimonas sp.]